MRYLPNVLIYALCEPDTGDVRYVGASKQALSYRLSSHLSSCKKEASPNSLWVRDLVSKGLKPTIKLLESVEKSEWQEAERRWIAYFREKNVPLLNVLIGGMLSSADYELTPTLKELKSVGMKKYYADPDHRSYKSAEMSRYYANHPEMRKKISEGLKAYQRSKRS